MTSCRTYLKSDVIAEAYRGQCDDTIVDRVEISPAFVMRKHRSTTSNNSNGEYATDKDELGLIDLPVAQSQTFLEHLQAK